MDSWREIFALSFHLQPFMHVDSELNKVRDTKDCLHVIS